ncbi:5-formyltetrahydrofolate cyclo-ligase [Bacillus sp. FJAT-42376]|uniref:5-formyltetrahydrofolate cyclo-ligase n=1 Tax=Bacillus sp. FJAT-42376 TaxID=2014076 RepID=UPI000F502563|nr:5-formyltetrahydrofolate cyclo-ligase [Bacillus sp. FJAT-42376]AZB44904.1 5-formyltetrahydrofolate cyclo-ligase [Bacillus sp. FJAT-42376]
MNKTMIRENMKILLNQMSRKQYTEYSAAIEEKFFQSSLWKNSHTIGLTISQNREADTRNIIEKGWEKGKRMAVPKCFPDRKEMEFRIITSFEQLETVYYGLKEPIPNQTERVEKNEIDVMAVPGIGFDPRGYRIGYGGGYYDRYLKDYPGKTVSLAFSFQVLPFIPSEIFDVPVQRILTEKEVLHCRE